jgi:serine/threonine protein kinase
MLHHYSPASSQPLTPNSLLLNRYQVQHLLGQGGMGAVYLVKDQRFGGALRAIKELIQDGLSPKDLQEATAAFEQEAILLAQLNHPNLPRIYDHFQAQGRWYLVMDYIDGQTLGDYLDQDPQKHLSVEKTLAISIQLCNVLSYLHARQPPVIFRDLKPANIMLTREEHVYLIDFGIARLFKPGQAVDTIALGSPGYAAPEQFGKAQTTARSDIYSLGVTMFQMLTGHDPSDTPFQFPPLTLPTFPGSRDLKTQVLKMIDIKIDQRPTDATNVRQSLQTITQQLQRPKRTRTPRTPAQKPVQPQTTQAPKQSSGKRAGSRASAAASSANNAASTLPELVVDKAGTGNYTSISDAINNAQPHSNIYILPGKYEESLLLDKPLQLIGRGPVSQIVLESQGTCVQIETDAATLKGLTLRGAGSQIVDISRGQPIVEECTLISTHENCDGIYINGVTANPTIRRCTIQQTYYGIWIATQAQGIIEECEISQAVASAVVVLQEANPLIRNCTIHDNQGTGIHFWQKGRGTIEDCKIYANKDASVNISNESSPIFRRCEIHHGNDGVCVSESQVVLDSCELHHLEDTGVTILNGGAPEITACKFYDNKRYGLYVFPGGKGSLKGCSFASNGINWNSEAPSHLTMV